jgi:hypothetical protein
LNSFGQFQTSQLPVMRASMGMMRKMSAPNPSAAGAAPPNQ